MTLLPSLTAWASWVRSGQEAYGGIFYPISARGVAERTPSFMYPQGTASSQMVLRGMDLLLECIASGVYVQPASPLWSLSRRTGGGNLCRGSSCRSLRRRKETQTAPSQAFAKHHHSHPFLAVFFMGNGQGKETG